jgi:hypothetical protein
MNTSTTTTAPDFAPSVWVPVTHLDASLLWAAGKLGKVSRISGAGAFWHVIGAPFVGAWVDHQEGGGGDLVLRLGRLELVASWRAPRSR